MHQRTGRATGILSLRCITDCLKLIWPAAIVLPAILFSGLTKALPGHQSGDVSWLRAGTAVERELGGGQSHLYQFTLAAGEFAKIEVEPLSISVVIELFDPGGTSQAKSGKTQEPESLRLVAETAGDYRLRVSAADREARAGRYKIVLVDVRPAAQRDRESVAADRLMNEGRLLAARNARESLQAAIGKYEQALALYRAAEDRRNEGVALNHLSVGYMNLGELPKALEFGLQALSLARAGGDRQGEAYLLLSTGVIYAYLGRSQESVESYRQALPLMRALGDRLGEGAVLASLGDRYQVLGQLDQARECFTQALPLFQSVGDKRGEGVTHNNLGALYRKLGNAPKALEHYEQALPLLRAANERNLESVTLDNLGVLYRVQGDLLKALEYFEQALSLRRTLGNKRAEAVTLDNIGAVHQRLGDLNKALEYHRQALPLLQAAGADLKAAITLNNIGDAQRRLGDLNGALASHEQAWQLLQAAGDRLAQATTLRKKAEIERELKRLTEARADIEQAIALLEFVRTNVAGEENRASFFATVADFYEFHTDLLMQMHNADPRAGYNQAALHVAEQSRARTLIEALAEASADIREGVSPQLLDRERELRRRLTAAFDNLNRLLGGEHDKLRRVAAEKEVASLTEDYRQVRAEIRRTSPRYADLTQPQPITTSEIQKQLLDEQTLLLEYALGEKRSYLWLVSQNSIVSHQLPPRAEIETAAKKIYQLLTARERLAGQTNPQRQAMAKRADAEFETQAASLSRMLLAPVAAELGDKRLLIVADGALQYLPFAALPVPEGRRAGERESGRAGERETGGQGDKGNLQSFTPLIVEHEIINLPSASVLAVLRKENAGRKLAPNSVIALADPVFELDDPRVGARQTVAVNTARGSDQKVALRSLSPELDRAVRSLNPDTPINLSRLPSTREEAEAIITVAGGSAKRIELDFNANREAAISGELSNYRIVHFATHGILNSAQPELSGLVFSLLDENARPRDGFLRLHEIYNLKLNADLIVLSACRTGLGKEIRGEGLIGLTRGFMYAGAPRVVASLWQVSDLATADLMRSFYRGMLKDGLRPAAALRAAQIEMWKQRRHSAPYYWAAFVLQGEWK
jgi:CHAT domain-containing protein/predicted negative regulator of RcsB-dependent stress response